MQWMRLVWIAVGVLALSALSPVHAQGDLPLTEGFVFKWGTENVFPEGAVFGITLSRPVDDLVDITLTITISGQEPQSHPIDLDEPVATGASFTTLEFLWTFPDDFAPRVFGDQDVIYEWQASDTFGQTARLRDAFVFRDDRVTWQQSEDPQGKIHLAVAADGPSAGRIRESVMLPYNLMAANVDAMPELNVVLYPVSVDPSGCQPVADAETGSVRQMAVGPFSARMLPCNPLRTGSLYIASGLDVVQSDGVTIAGAQSALVRFMSQRFYMPVWGAADVPDWFLSGLSQFYLPTSQARLLLPVRDAARVDDLFTLDDMASGKDDDPLWLAQSYGMVLYVADQIGVPGLFDLANDLATSPSFQVAYETATGQTLDALLPNLSRWVFTDAAAHTFNYTPYQPETPTPVPSRTRTPFPPTATFTVTASATATLTPSVTGVLSATPSNTPTVTRTPTPRPPTVTPRPPDSLYTPTPAPTQGLLDNPVNRLGIIVVLLILMAILGLVYLVVIRRHD